MRELGAQVLGVGLLDHPRLKILEYPGVRWDGLVTFSYFYSLGHNAIGDGGAEAVAAVVKTMPCLETLE